MSSRGNHNNEIHTPVLLVEAESWEQGDLEHKCPHGCRFITTRKRLDEMGDDELPPNVTILSPFIHSECSARQLRRLGDLRMIATRSTGFDHIDLPECNQRGIVVSNVPHYGEDTVAEHTFALLLALTRKIHRGYERTVRGDFSLEGLRGTDLHGKTFGCLGTGSIGQRVLRIAGGFGMHRIAYDTRPNDDLAAEMGFEYVDLEELLTRSNVLSIHVPHNEQMYHMIDAEALSRLPAGAFLINTARGGIVEPQALIDALKSGRMGGAGLDVLESERAIGEEVELMSSSYDMDTLRSVIRSHALLRMPNVIITPHVAFNSDEALERIIDTTIANIHAFLEGRCRNMVNMPVPTAAA